MRKTYRFFGIPVWSVEVPEDDEVGDLDAADHQGGSFDFGFSPPPYLDGGLRSAPGYGDFADW